MAPDIKTYKIGMWIWTGNIFTGTQATCNVLTELI